MAEVIEEDPTAAREDNLHRELTGVLFPAVVKNDEKALQCLGGIKAISQVHMQSNKKRLDMSFQYENPFVKKMYADLKKTSGVVLKIKIKKIKLGNEIKREVVSTTVVGSVKNMYKFESMGDFQYLPIEPNAPGGRQFKCLLENILPSGTDHVTTILNPSPTFIVPANFTRSDKTINYFYTERRYGSREIKNEESIKVDCEETHRMRDARAAPVMKYTFNLVDNIPTEPNEYYIQIKNAKVASYPQIEQEFEVLKKLFEERPIWSMNHIRYRTKTRLATLKILLPCIAFNVREGPWRMMWIRFGYDPRKEPDARKYQTLDFRLRHAGAGVHTMVVTRDEVVHVKKTNRLRPGKKHLYEEKQHEDVVSEGAVLFRPGLVPTQRQIFYQYCDVELPEVQALVSAPPPPGYTCHPKLGWLSADTELVARDHVFRYTKNMLLATHNAELKLEQASTSDEMSSDDETAADTSTFADVSALADASALVEASTSASALLQVSELADISVVEDVPGTADTSALEVTTLADALPKSNV